jgi:hypothetical protein
MSDEITREVRRETGDGTDLWRVITPLWVWAAHFLFSYVLGAVHCAKAGRAADLAPVQLAVSVVTVVALVIIGAVAASLLRVHRRSMTDNDFEFEHNSPEERHRFLSHVALMNCLLSAAGVGYVALPVFILETCL